MANTLSSLRDHVSRLRLGQFNLGRCQAKSVGLAAWAAQVGLDIVALQEPYTYRGEFRDVGPGARVIANWTAANPPKAAFVAFFGDLPVMNLRHLGDSDTVIVEVYDSGERLYLVSLYCQFGTELEPYLEQITQISNALQG